MYGKNSDKTTVYDVNLQAMRQTNEDSGNVRELRAVYVCHAVP